MPKEIEGFVSKSFRSCLSKKSRDLLKSECPVPELPALVVPKMDKDVSSFLGNQFPQSSEKTLSKVQYTIVSSAAPLLNLVSDLSHQGFTGAPNELIPVDAVLTVAKESIALIGNSFNYVNEARRKNVLESMKAKCPRLAGFIEDICKDDLGEDTSELFGPVVKKKITERASTFKSLNESLADLDGQSSPHLGVIKRIVFWGKACLPNSQPAANRAVTHANQAGRSRVFNYRTNNYSRGNFNSQQRSLQYTPKSASQKGKQYYTNKGQ